MKYHHTSIEERFAQLMAESPSFRAAVEQAQRWATNSRKQARIYKANGVYCMRNATDPYYGTHETFINPA